MTAQCIACDDTRWVCENHPDQPWTGPHACTCGSAGAPCPRCNKPDNGEVPQMPRGFITIDKRGSDEGEA